MSAELIGFKLFFIVLCKRPELNIGRLSLPAWYALPQERGPVVNKLFLCFKISDNFHHVLFNNNG